MRLAKCVTRAKLVIDSEDGKSERTDALIAIEECDICVWVQKTFDLSCFAQMSNNMYMNNNI